MTAPAIVSPILTALNTRVLASSEDRDAWLAARRPVITATEAKVFLTGSTGEKHQIIREKVTGESSFKGNQYTENGNRREPHIIAWLERFGFAGCGLLIHADGVQRHAATPDAWRLTFDEEIELAEIKTSKNDVAPWTEHFDRAGYYLQMQWQMYCLGAARVLYVWEQHDDDWSRWPEVGPTPLGDPLTEWIDRDDEVIRKLIVQANRWLVKLDEALVAAPEVDPILDALAVDVLVGRREEAAGKAKKDDAWKRLLSALAGRGELSQRSGSAQVTWTPPATSSVPRAVVDEEAARAAHMNVWAKVHAARGKAAAAEAEWADVLTRFTTTSDESVTTSAKLTVTSVRKGGDS